MFEVCCIDLWSGIWLMAFLLVFGLQKMNCTLVFLLWISSDDCCYLEASSILNVDLKHSQVLIEYLSLLLILFIRLFSLLLRSVKSYHLLDLFPQPFSSSLLKPNASYLRCIPLFWGCRCEKISDLSYFLYKFCRDIHRILPHFRRELVVLMVIDYL